MPSTIRDLLKLHRERRHGGFSFGGVHLGERPWLVLSGGGMKGMAHLGCWEVLQKAGFEPAGILGTSIGGLVGACLAGGLPVEQLQAEALRLNQAMIAPIHRRALWVNGIRSPGLFRGDTLREYLERILPPAGWEAILTRFQVNAVELGSGRTEWFGIGARTDVSLVEAVYATAALPLFYPPISLPGGMYVDGGVDDSLPIRRAIELGATGVLAIDAGSGAIGDANRAVEQGLLGIHQRVFSIMSGRERRRVVAEWKGPPLLYIRPELDGYGTFDFHQIERFIDLGREALQRVLVSGAASTGTP